MRTTKEKDSSINAGTSLSKTKLSAIHNGAKKISE
jgi:hypothetical protein